MHLITKSIKSSTTLSSLTLIIKQHIWVTPFEKGKKKVKIFLVPLRSTKSLAHCFPLTQSNFSSSAASIMDLPNTSLSQYSPISYNHIQTIHIYIYVRFINRNPDGEYWKRQRTIQIIPFSA